MPDSDSAHGRLQFSLAQLLGAAAVFCVYLAMTRYLGSGILIVLFFAACWWGLRPARRQDQYVFGAYVVSMHVAFMACGSVWYTHGEVKGFGSWMNWIGLGIVSVIACGARAYRIALLVVTIACANLVYHQMPLVWKLRELEAEVAAIGRYIEEHHRLHGKYPSDIDGFQFTRSDLKSLIEYSPGWVIQYELRKGECFDRRLSRQGWYYYPD
jgi:hypothetical protein